MVLLRLALLLSFCLACSLPGATPLKKTSNSAFDVYDEAKAYVRKLVETDREVGAQWKAHEAVARARTGRISTGPWIATQWLVPNFEFNTRSGRDAEYVILVRQALREAQVDGYVVEDNVVARVRAKLHEDVEENPQKAGEFVTTKAELTLTFEGFVRVTFPPTGPSLARPAETKRFSANYNEFEEVAAYVGRLVDGDPQVKAAWEALAAKARENAGGRFQTSGWAAVQWQIPSFEETKSDRYGDYVFIVKQALREGQRGGYIVNENVCARVRAKVKDKVQPAANGSGLNVTKGELTMTFEGFVQTVLDERLPAVAVNRTPPSTKAAKSDALAQAFGGVTSGGGNAPPAPPARPSATTPPPPPPAEAAPATPPLTAAFLVSTPGTYGWQPVGDDRGISYDFFKDGRLHIQGPDGEASMWEGRWSLQGDKLTLKNTTLKTTKTVVASVSGNTLLIDGRRYRRYKPE